MAGDSLGGACRLRTLVLKPILRLRIAKLEHRLLLHLLILALPELYADPVPARVLSTLTDLHLLIALG